MSGWPIRRLATTVHGVITVRMGDDRRIAGILLEIATVPNNDVWRYRKRVSTQEPTHANQAANGHLSRAGLRDRRRRAGGPVPPLYPPARADALFARAGREDVHADRSLPCEA